MLRTGDCGNVAVIVNARDGDAPCAYAERESILLDDDVRVGDVDDVRVGDVDERVGDV